LPGKPVKTHQITISPLTGVVKKKAAVAVEVTLTVRTTLNLRQVICLDIEGLGRYFLMIRLESEKSVFGVDISELSLTHENGVQVPEVLVRMKNYLYENGGLEQEGVFRLAGDESETILVKEKLNDGTFINTKDINCIANLIKVWFRELPQQLLNQLSAQSLLTCETEEDCIPVYGALKDPNRTLMDWLLNLMADVASKESVNKMNPRNLAIVIAPNLFAAPPEFSPIDSLMLSQKVVNFVLQILQCRIRLRK